MRFFRRFVDAIKKVFDGNKKYQQYVYDAEKLLGVFERAVKADGNKKISGVAETRTAIARTTDNKRFVVTDRDILDGVEESKWRNVVSDNLKEKYPDGIILGKNQVSVNQTSRKEMTYSDYATWLAKHSPEIFGDKLRATDNADEILTVASNWISEGLNHPRKDKIKDFARGKVLLEIGGKDYSAEVLVGTTSGGNMILYDIVNLTPTLINKKESIASTAVSAQKRPTTESLTIDNSNISHSDGNVNTKSALSSKSAVTSAPAGENSVFDDKQRKDVIRKLSAVAKQNGVARLDKDSFVTDAMGILEGALQTGIVSDGIVELILTLMF